MDAWPNVDQRQLGCVEHVQWCDALIHPVVRLEERTAALSLVVMPVLVQAEAARGNPAGQQHAGSGCVADLDVRVRLRDPTRRHRAELVAEVVVDRSCGGPRHGSHDHVGGLDACRVARAAPTTEWRLLLCARPSQQLKSATERLLAHGLVDGLWA